jgi:hypothetical protein
MPTRKEQRRTSEQNVKLIRRRAEKVIARSLRIVGISMEGRTAADIRAASELPRGDAPAWYMAAERLAAAATRADDSGAQGGTTLNVLITAPAPSVQQWLDGASKVKAIAAVGVTPAPARAEAATDPEAGEGKPVEARRSRAKA